MDGRKRKGRKLLVATLGVAAVSYVGCSSDTETVANLMAPDARDARADRGSPADVVANLVAPDVGSGGSPADVVANLVAPDVGFDRGSPLDVVANLVPPPRDASVE